MSPGCGRNLAQHHSDRLQETINQRLAAVRRLAYEAADSGLLSPELAASVRQVKGALAAMLAFWLAGRMDEPQRLEER